MKKRVNLLIVAMTIAGLCAGCRQENTAAPAAAKPAPAVAGEWTPETAPAAHDPNDGGDHSGHNH